MGDSKSEVLSGRFTKREARIVEGAAKADNQTLADYIRTAVLTTAVLDGNVEAVKYLGEQSRIKLARVAKRLIPEVFTEEQV